MTVILEEISIEFPEYRCSVDMRDPMPAKVYAVSKRSEDDFPNFPEELREGKSSSLNFNLL